MNHELMMWEGVCEYFPMTLGRAPAAIGKFEAAIRALAETNDVVIVDAGQVDSLRPYPICTSGVR